MIPQTPLHRSLDPTKGNQSSIELLEVGLNKK